MIMAYYAKHILSALLIIVFALTLHTEARESKFFSKATHNTDNNHEIGLAAPVLAPAPAPSSQSGSSFSGEGYGLYGHMPSDESNDVKPEKFTQSYNQEETRYPYNYNNGYGENGHGLYEHMSNEESSNVKPEKFTQSYNQDETRYTYNYNNGYKSNDYNKDLYNDNHDEKGYVNKGYKSDNHNNGYTNGKLGMSNTVFSENGKYYGSVENVNNYDNGYRAESGIGKKSEFEFDTMGEYEKQQGYSEIQGEYYSP